MPRDDVQAPADAVFMARDLGAQSVFIIESKDEADMENEYDVFRILSTASSDEGALRSCAELGHA